MFAKSTHSASDRTDHRGATDARPLGIGDPIRGCRRLKKTFGALVMLALLVGCFLSTTGCIDPYAAAYYDPYYYYYDLPYYYLKGKTPDMPSSTISHVDHSAANSR